MCRAVMIMLGETENGEDSVSIVKWLRNPGRIKCKIVCYDPLCETEDKFENVSSNFFTLPEYNVDTISRKSKVAGLLCRWTLAVTRYREFITRTNFPYKV